MADDEDDDEPHPEMCPCEECGEGILRASAEAEEADQEGASRAIAGALFLREELEDTTGVPTAEELTMQYRLGPPAPSD